MTRAHEAMKDIDVREIVGHVVEKFWRYTRWQSIENATCVRGRESKRYKRTCRAIIA